MSALDRLSEIKARVRAATPGPWHWDFRPSVKVLDLVSLTPWRPMVMTFRRWGMYCATACFRTAEHPAASQMRAPHEGGCAWPHPDAELIAHARVDLEWAIEEIDYLRRCNDALEHLVFALDGLRWALQEPGPGRLEARRKEEEEARQALREIPDWREGECHRGCRRYATHELVIVKGDDITREPRCEECGRIEVVSRLAAIAAGMAPAATVRLEPASREVEGIG